MELLGPNLEDLFQFCGGKFSLKTTLMIALQILDRLELIHNAGFIYRDIKPENFLTGIPSGPNSNMIYIVDFGLTITYLNANGEHYQFCDAKVMTGTARSVQLFILYVGHDFWKKQVHVCQLSYGQKSK